MILRKDMIPRHDACGNAFFYMPNKYFLTLLHLFLDILKQTLIPPPLIPIWFSSLAICPLAVLSIILNDVTTVFVVLAAVSSL
jgi:hypothetical protein